MLKTWRDAKVLNYQTKKSHICQTHPYRETLGPVHLSPGCDPLRSDSYACTNPRRTNHCFHWNVFNNHQNLWKSSVLKLKLYNIKASAAKFQWNPLHTSAHCDKLPCALWNVSLHYCIPPPLCLLCCFKFSQLKNCKQAFTISSALHYMHLKFRVIRISADPRS